MKLIKRTIEEINKNYHFHNNKRNRNHNRNNGTTKITIPDYTIHTADTRIVYKPETKETILVTIFVKNLNFLSTAVVINI